MKLHDDSTAGSKCASNEESSSHMRESIKDDCRNDDAKINNILLTSSNIIPKDKSSVDARIIDSIIKEDNESVATRSTSSSSVFTDIDDEDSSIITESEKDWLQIELALDSPSSEQMVRNSKNDGDDTIRRRNLNQERLEIKALLQLSKRRLEYDFQKEQPSAVAKQQKMFHNESNSYTSDTKACIHQIAREYMILEKRSKKHQQTHKGPNAQILKRKEQLVVGPNKDSDNNNNKNDNIISSITTGGIAAAAAQAAAEKRLKASAAVSQAAAEKRNINNQGNTNTNDDDDENIISPFAGGGIAAAAAQAAAEKRLKIATTVSQSAALKRNNNNKEIDNDDDEGSPLSSPFAGGGIAALAAKAAAKKKRGLSGKTSMNKVKSPFSGGDIAAAVAQAAATKNRKNSESSSFDDKGSKISTVEIEDTPLKNDPKYAKYFKMLKFLPMEVVKHKMSCDGLDSTIMDLDHDKSIKSQLGTPLKDDPEYTKYYKMLKFLPMDVVKHKLTCDGKDPGVMDLDPNKSLKSQQQQKKNNNVKGNSKTKKKGVRRRRIHWTPIDQEKIREGSIWEMVREIFKSHKISYDQNEFKNLFVESIDTTNKKKENAKMSKKDNKKKVALIDGKRSHNGGISLKPLKREYSEIAEMINQVDPEEFNAAQIKALREFLPTAEERPKLKEYLKEGKDSSEETKRLLSVLPECEKYMIAMLDVNNADRKLDAMLFKIKFQEEYDALLQDLEHMKVVCDEVRNSERLRKIFGIILIVVNQINTGDKVVEKPALGFNLESLKVLMKSKTFDKETSFLEYLAKIIRQNNKELLNLKEELETVLKSIWKEKSENDKLETSKTGIEDLKEELEKVAEIAMKLAPEQKRDGTVNKSDPDIPEDEEEEDRDRANSSLATFIMEARKNVDGITKQFEDLQESYNGLLRYFCNDEHIPSNDFFRELKDFVKEFKSAADKVEIIETEKEKEITKKKNKEHKKKISTLKKIAIKAAIVGKEMLQKANSNKQIAFMAAAAAIKVIKDFDESRRALKEISNIAANAALGAIKNAENGRKARKEIKLILETAISSRKKSEAKTERKNETEVIGRKRRSDIGTDIDYILDNLLEHVSTKKYLASANLENNTKRSKKYLKVDLDSHMKSIFDIKSIQKYSDELQFELIQDDLLLSISME